MKRERLEKVVQREIELALGSEPDLILLRNSQGNAEYISKTTGDEYHVPYGLGVGTPDIVGLLRLKLRRREQGSEIITRESDGAVFARTTPITVAVWFCLEVKAPGGEGATPTQMKVHALWRRFGAFVEVVDSVVNARAALGRARKGQSS